MLIDNDDASLEMLITRLSDDEADIRSQAAEALGKLGWQPETIDQKIAYVIARKAWDDCEELGESALSSLITCLGDEDWSVRQNVVKALGKLDDDCIVDLLIACLGDEHDCVCRSAAETLGHLRDSRAVPGLVILLTDTTPLCPDKQIGDIAAKALEAIGTRQALAAVKAWQADKVHFNPSAFLAKWSQERS